MALSLAACGGSDTTTTTTTPTVTPSALVLTTSNDLFDSNDFTTAADTVTGTQTTYEAADVIADATSGDGDTMTIAATDDISAAPTVVGIENIVFNVTSFTTTGADGEFDLAATGISGGTITINSLQTGTTVDSAAVTSAGNVTVVAGTAITDTLTVSMVADASTVVNAGGAATVVIDATGTTAAEIAAQTITFVSAGNVNLTVTDANTVAISGTGNVTLNASSTDVSGTVGSISGTSGQTLILADTDTVDGGAITGFGTVQFDATTDGDSAIDAYGFAGTLHATAGASADVLTVASGANITLDGDVSIGVDLDDGSTTTTTTTGVANVTLAEASTATNGTTIELDATGDRIGTLNVTASANQTAGDLTINATAATAVTLAGSGNVDLVTSGFTTAASTLNASALTGVLTVTVDAQLLDITGGSGADAITALTAVAFDLDGGAGVDTLTLAADMSAGTFTNFEILSGTGDFLSTQLGGLNAVVADGSTITIGAGDVHSNTINLSGLTFADATNEGVSMASATQDTAVILNNSAMNITGSNGADTLLGYGGADTINGGAGADTISAAAGADTLTGGTGVDTFTVSSTEASMDHITDFSLTATAATAADILDVAGTTVAAVTAGASTGVTNVTATVTAGGIMTLQGTAASTIDTLAEWIDAVETVAAGAISDSDGTGTGTVDYLNIAFEFGGDTYVLTGHETDGASYATDSVIALDGVTGATGIDIAANLLVGEIAIV